MTKRNVVFSLRNRETKSDNCRRTDFKILKTLIVHSQREFKKVWSKQSTSTFCYEGGYLFSENYRVCHSGYTVNGSLKEKYRLPKLEAIGKNKIEEAIIYKCYHENFHKFENRACLIGILSRNTGESLVQYDLSTGNLLKEIYLSPIVKFKHISWVESNELFVVKSKQPAVRSGFHMIPNSALSIAIVMAVFSSFPLQFVGMFEVNRRIFGAGIQDAVLSHSFLIVMFITGHVRLYSFPDILEKFKLSDHTIDNNLSCSYSREFPYGSSLPMNIKITECPPVLFEVKCADKDVQFGGFPWHYIITPHGSYGTFSIHSLGNDKKAKKGTLNSQSVNLEPDCCLFHDDNSGRILHIVAPEIRVLEIKSEEGNEKSEIETVNTISLNPQPEETEFPYQVTSSGRLVRREQHQEEIDSSNDVNIHQVQYEDELDVAWISSTHHHPVLQNAVRFYDNSTFDLLREVQLSEQGNLAYENLVYVDLDTIVHVSKPRLGRYMCIVYRLAGDQQPAQLNTTSEHKHGRKISSQKTTRTRKR